MIDALLIYHDRHPRELSAAVAEYCGRAFKRARSAEEDVRAAMDVLVAQLEQHADLPRSLNEMLVVADRVSD